MTEYYIVQTDCSFMEESPSEDLVESSLSSAHETCSGHTRGLHDATLAEQH